MTVRRVRWWMLVLGAAAAIVVALRLWDGSWTARPYRLLVSSSAAGNPRIVQLLLWLGLDPDAEVEGRGFPLFAAAGTGQRRVVALLLDRGADVNHRTKHGNTALQAALHARQLDLAQELMMRGADLEIAGEDGPPLLAAVRACQPEAVELLLRNGANPDAASPMGTAREYSNRHGCSAVRAMFEQVPTTTRLRPGARRGDAAANERQ
jgi:ankyrin repeat protein